MVGEVLSKRYKILEIAGEGGMATVYRAMDLLLDRKVAIKFLNPKYSENPNFLARFQREAKAAAALHHPNVVTVYDTNQEESAYYIVMEYVEGKVLKDIIRDRAPLSISQAVNITAQVGQALGHAHENGLIHRDIKPQNIILRPDGLAKVTDFGIARALSQSSLTETGTILGTAQYFSPEQAQGQVADEQSDIYSLGIVLYEMITGHLPFKGDTTLASAFQRVYQPPLDPKQFNPEISAELERVLGKCLERDKEKRYTKAETLVGDLKNVLAPSSEAQTEIFLSSEHSFRDLPPPSSSVEKEVSFPEKASFLSRAKRVLSFAVLTATLALAGLLIGLFIRFAIIPGESTRKVKTPKASAKVLSFVPVDAKIYDPQGDGTEYEEKIGNTYDGDESTTWYTQGYRTAAFGNLKEGVGFYHDLGEAKTVSTVEIVSTEGGWDCTLKGSNDGTNWKEIKSYTDMPSRHTFKLSSQPYRYYLIWITKLTSVPGQKWNRVEIAEVKYSGKQE